MKRLLLAFLLLSTTTAGAATHEVKMLNMGKEGAMVFEPAFLKVAKGDTVKFVPTDPAHEVSSVYVPKGGKPFKGAMNKAVTVKLDAEGVYVYECATHIAMAMIGVLQVGPATNIADARAATKSLVPKMVMNKERLEKYLAQAK